MLKQKDRLFGVAGGLDLDILCGVSNERCTIPRNPDGSVDTTKPIEFKGNLDEFIKTPEGQKLPGATGGIQGEKGTLFGVPYAAGSWQDKSREEISSSGYVVHTLEAALWAVGTTFSFEDALVAAVNLGHDADTVGAVAGQLAGARYGVRAIPVRWSELLIQHDAIDQRARDLASAGA